MATPTPTPTPPTQTPTLINSLPAIQAFLSSLPASGSTLFLDLEGKNLSRHGTLSLLTIHVLPTKTTSIIDVQTLSQSAFTTSVSNGSGRTLKTILEDPHIPKYFWDVRNDADALFSHHRVRLQGVTDIQLLENATRVGGDRTYLNGLDKCVRQDLRLSYNEARRWATVKEGVKRLMNVPNQTDNIFTRRPLDEKTVRYCVNDVVYLPKLYALYKKRINGVWLQKVMDESGRRVVEACSAGYEPHSEKKKFGPWGAELGGRKMTMWEWIDNMDDEFRY
ncbi:ribonuclease H-like domain-containing protein [Sordaria brevicollis]|uniref:Ribonuclease H-like domain-containing protein n=1 Tax=Sordaria brevicollis TaxID=83679 RepID=A0AAE0UFF7_SORBR|nr:ribonuclease H-like domain-containing protein [Sordaria brevicollis]